MRDDIQNFSLNYRHLFDKNPDHLKVILILHIKMAERKGIRVLIHEKDNIKELGNRLCNYLFQHSNMFLH